MLPPSTGVVGGTHECGVPKRFAYFTSPSVRGRLSLDWEPSAVSPTETLNAPSDIRAQRGIRIALLSAIKARVLATVHPHTSPVVVAGLGGAAGGGRFRAARTISATLPPRMSTPPTSSPIATQSKNDSLAPRSTSGPTPPRSSGRSAVAAAHLPQSDGTRPGTDRS